MPCSRFAFRRSFAVILAAGVATLWTAGGTGRLDQAQAAEGQQAADPSVVPPVSWLLKPVETPDASAATEAEMKPYTREDHRHRRQVRHGADPRRQVHDGQPEQRRRTARTTKARNSKSRSSRSGWASAKSPGTSTSCGAWASTSSAARSTERQPTEWDKLADAITMPTKPYTDMTFGMGKEGYAGHLHDPIGRQDVLQVAVGQDRPLLPPADRSRMGIRLPRGHEDRLSLRRRSGEARATTPGTSTTATTSITRSARRSRIPGACTTCTATWPSGCSTSTSPDGYKQAGRQAGREPARPPHEDRTRASCAAARGSTTPTALRSAARMGSDKDWKAQDPQIPQSIWYLTDADSSASAWSARCGRPRRKRPCSTISTRCRNKICSTTRKCAAPSSRAARTAVPAPSLRSPRS